MGYYRCITNKNMQIEYDPSYTVMINNNNNNEYPLKGNCAYQLGNYSNSFPVIIGNNVVNCSYTFQQSSSYFNNQPIIIPNNTADCSYMFSYYHSYVSDIYMYNSTINCTNMLYRTDNARTKNVYCTNLETAKNVYTDLSWTPMTNGAYNAATNIYLYTNLI